MTDGKNRYQAALKEGHSAAWDQNWFQAAEFYKQALNEKPRDPKAHSSLALALYELGDFKDALAHYMLVAEKTPQDPVPIEKIALIYDVLKKPDIGSRIAVRAAETYLNSGDVDKAIENWVRATEMDPENITAHSRLAVVYERMRRNPQAVKAYLQIASILQHSDQVEKAVQVINRALKLSPDDDEATQALITIREGKMLPEPIRIRTEIDPLSITEPALLKEPEIIPDKDQTPIQEAEQEALTDLAALFFEQKIDEDELRKTKTGGLKQIVNGTGSIIPQEVDSFILRLHLGQVVDFLSRGEKNEAADDLNKLIEVGLHHPAVYYQLGLIRFENDRLESAIRNLRRSVNHSDYSLASRLLIAHALKQQGKVNESSLECLEALKIADSQIVPKDQTENIKQLYAPLIEAHAQKPDENDSEKMFNSIVELLNHPGWRQNLIKIRNELNIESDYKIPIAEVLTSVSSSQVVVAISAIRKLANEGRRHAAFEEACFTLQSAPTYLPLHITIGDTLLAGNQVEAAIEKYKVVSRSYDVRGESGRAVEMLRRVVELSPLDLDARRDLIDQLIFRGQHEDVIKEYIKMAETYYTLADLTEARRTYTRGLRFINQVKLGDEWRVEILLKIADIDVQSLNWRHGLEIFDRICVIDPDNIEAQRNRIELRFRMGERKQALTAVESLVQKQKTMNRSGDLVILLEQLSEDWPKETIIKNLLADLYLDLGRTPEAIDQYDRVLRRLLEDGNKEGALVQVNKIISLKPENIDMYTELLDRMR